MDSLLDPSAFGDTEAVAPDGWRRRLQRALLPRMRQRARLLELDFWRCAALALTLCALTTVGGLAWLWQARAQAAATSAVAALAFLDARLDEIDTQAQSLAADVTAAILQAA